MLGQKGRGHALGRATGLLTRKRKKGAAWAGPVWADGRSGLPAGKGERGAGWAAKRVWAGFWVH